MSKKISSLRLAAIFRTNLNSAKHKNIKLLPKAQSIKGDHKITYAFFISMLHCNENKPAKQNGKPPLVRRQKPAQNNPQSNNSSIE